MKKVLKIGVFVITAMMSFVSFANTSDKTNAQMPPPPNFKVCAKQKNNVTCIRKISNKYCSQYPQTAYCKTGHMLYCADHPHSKNCAKK